MKKEKSIRGKVVACAFVLLMVGVLFAGVVPVAAAPTWTVDDSGGADFTSIQDAVDAASSGDTIIVYPGTYVENINVNKDHLTIKSESGAEATIVQAANPGNHVFDVMVSEVTITGFTVKGAIGDQNAGIFVRGCDVIISNNIVLNNYYGISIKGGENQLMNNKANSNKVHGILVGSGSNDNTLLGNEVNSNNCHGISLASSNNNTLIKNKANSNGRSGIWVSANSHTIVENHLKNNNDYGIFLLETSNNLLKKNTASSNFEGIRLERSHNNILTENEASANGRGISLSTSRDNILTKNSISDNGRGIRLDTQSNNNILTKNVISNNAEGILLLYSSDNNKICSNNFINNIKNVWSYYSTNIWNSSSKITYTYSGNTYTNYMGNYWNDYTDVDANNDGIWDNPYSIDSDNDYYPLLDPFENYDVPPQGKIAFASSRNGNQEVYVINADGSGHPTNLTNFPDADDGDPTWSPDGKQIAFSSDRSGNWKTYVMDADDGSNQVCLLEGVYDAWGPAWSPDGKVIAFACQLSSDDDFEIYTMDIQSKAFTQVTDNGVTDCHPAWSPNSHKIVFTSTRDGNHELYVADLLAGTQTRLTDDPAYDDYPEWSPDGSMIVFVSERDGNQEIYSMNIASKAITRLTYNEHTDKHAQYSPDGQKIIFVSNRDGCGDLDVYVMNADGTSIACLVDWEGDETHPTWSPSSAHDQPPTCAIELQKNGVPIANINVGEFFDIYVGGSTDDQGIKEVRFSSDDSQEGNPTGEWTEWYDWDISSEDWDAANKIKAWSFATAGDKEVWAEVEDGDGKADRCRANIFAHPGYAIIVAGQDRGLTSQKCAIDHSANNAYRVLHNLGFDDNHIFYLNSEVPQDIDGDGNDEVDAPASHSNFNSAVLDVKGKIGNNPIPFVLYLVGHGSQAEDDPESFFFEFVDGENEEALTPASLNNVLWSFSSPVLIVIGSCHSGGFITSNTGISVKDRNRIIITAAHDDAETQDSALGLGGWYYSSDRFWENLNKGLNVKDAFIPNTWWLGEQKYLWLDDNGDKKGHPPDNLGNDGALASTTTIGVSGTDDLELMTWYSVWIHSAGEIRVYDSQNRVTGLVNGEVKEEIPDSIYDEQDETVAIFSPSDDSYRYEIAGTEEGTYGLDIASIEDGEGTIFTATDIPTAVGATHEYSVDWNALSQGEAGVTVQIDSDGDGTFEYIFTADNELTQEEFLSGSDGEPIPEFTSIAIPVAIVLGLVFLISRRKRKR